jgi:hypothetical protein
MGRKIEEKFGHMSRLILMPCVPLAVSVFHKDELMQEELRQWLDAEFSAISDAVLRDGRQPHSGDTIN